ncbi:delta 9-fatty acid desaturase protein [Panus rudis PR-1116 ss-1]|nr:delta 9-fatty acid desaturase protein [Panus rudis PR-1116 ss-1]
MDLFRRVIWFNLLVVTFTPLAALWGLLSTSFNRNTLAFSSACYVWNMLGYHRLWSHRSYDASKPLQYFLAVAGAGGVQGSIRWWSRSHRAHHRYTDTDRDPYGAHHGLWWSHLGWMLVRPLATPGAADISDLKHNVVVEWQHRWFFFLAFCFGILIPTAVPGCLWGDWRGGFYFAGLLRLTFVHHSTFSVNSLAHWLGHTTFDDKLTPRDHLFTAIVTLGEGYHNFHHQFPTDYRNAIKWYQWDPTKWFIAVCAAIGLASHLRRFPDTEVKKSQLTMKLKSLKRVCDGLDWHPSLIDLPVVDWATLSIDRPIILVSGVIHDIGGFLDQHPGGRGALTAYIGKDATPAFFGGVYAHSNAAQNLLATMRVGTLLGGVEHGGDRVPPCRKLQIVSWDGSPSL